MMSLFRSGSVLILYTLLLAVSRTRAKITVQLPDNFFNVVKTKLTWSVHPEELNLDEVRAGIKNALDFWENHTRFTFEEVPLKGSPANIRFHILRDFYGPRVYVIEDKQTKISVARTIYLPDELSGIVFVTSYEIWNSFSRRSKNALNIESVVKHQLGYIIGQKDTAAFSSIMTPNYQIRDISNLTKENKYEPLFFGIEFNDVRTAIEETYKIPKRICRPNFDKQAYDETIALFTGKYFYNRSNGAFALVRDHWPRLPENLKRIDGLYDDPRGFQIFFIGKQAYAIKNDGELLADCTLTLNCWLRTAGLDHVDSVFRHDTGMYVVSRKNAWKFERKSEDGYSITSLPSKVSYPDLSGISQAHIEDNYYETGVNVRSDVTFDWLDFACRQAQEELVPPECCNL